MTDNKPKVAPLPDFCGASAHHTSTMPRTRPDDIIFAKTGFLMKAPASETPPPKLPDPTA